MIPHFYNSLNAVQPLNNTNEGQSYPRRAPVTALHIPNDEFPAAMCIVSDDNAEFSHIAMNKSYLIIIH